MKPLIETPPRTLMEVYKTLPEGTLAELIDSKLYMSPSPVLRHQRILKKIMKQLDTVIEDTDKGDVLIAPFDVYLDEERNAVQPDITVVLKTNPGDLNDSGHFHGIPDLIIEILSPGNKKHDTILKKEIYESFGVKEYWIVDPETRVATGFFLESKSYSLLGEESGIICSRLLQSSFPF